MALVRPAATPAGELAESVPPSANKLLRELGLLDAVLAAGFEPNLGNTVWWARRPERREPFHDGERGVHVERRALESALVRAAEAAGVRVYDGFAAREARQQPADAPGAWTVGCRASDGRTVDVHATWLIDATGRRGFLARREGRERDPGPATLALIARFRRPGGWDDVEGAAEGHTLVESWEDGWAWSVPLDREVRSFAAMVDRQGAGGGRVDAAAAFRHAIARAPNLGRVVASAEPAGRSWACSASLYASRRFARAGVLLAGDAGSFIDPLSSFGVKKALSSGWLAGVAAHTALVDPPLADVALDFFDRRERAVWQTYRRVALPFYEEAARVYGHAYWRRRAAATGAAVAREHAEGVPGLDPADPDELGPATVPEADVRRAFEGIRARPRLAAARGPSLRTFRAPAIDGHRIVLQDQLASDPCPKGLRYARGVDLRRLVEEALRHDDVPELWSAYNRAGTPVSLPDFLTALSLAFAVGFLEHRDG